MKTLYEKNIKDSQKDRKGQKQPSCSVDDSLSQKDIDDLKNDSDDFDVQELNESDNEEHNNQNKEPSKKWDKDSVKKKAKNIQNKYKCLTKDNFAKDRLDVKGLVNFSAPLLFDLLSDTGLKGGISAYEITESEEENEQVVTDAEQFNLDDNEMWIMKWRPNNPLFFIVSYSWTIFFVFITQPQLK